MSTDYAIRDHGIYGTLPTGDIVERYDTLRAACEDWASATRGIHSSHVLTLREEWMGLPTGPALDARSILRAFREEDEHVRMVREVRRTRLAWEAACAEHGPANTYALHSTHVAWRHAVAAIESAVPYRGEYCSHGEKTNNCRDHRAAIDGAA